MLCTPLRGRKPTAESVGISKLCHPFMMFPSGYCCVRVEIQCIPVDIDTANLFFTVFPFIFVSSSSSKYDSGPSPRGYHNGKQQLGYDNKTNGEVVINGTAVSGSIASTRKGQEPLGYVIIERRSYEIPMDSAVGFLLLPLSSL